MITGFIEAVCQLRGTAEARQVKNASAAIVHGKGGVLSSHCIAILTAESRYPSLEESCLWCL